LGRAKKEHRRIFQRCLRFIQSNKKESIDILAAYSKSDHETATNMFESYFPAYSREGSITNEALQAAIDDAMMRRKSKKPLHLRKSPTVPSLPKPKKNLAYVKRRHLCARSR
jgi:hypothetical protein